jgi:hypothetical protein
MDVEVLEALENDLSSEPVCKKKKYENVMDRFRKSSASSSAAATSKRAAVASAVQYFNSESRSASHAYRILAEASYVVLSSIIGTSGFNGA